MKKTVTLSKKVISVLCCVAILFSFATAFAVHSSAVEAGKYTWRVKVNVGDNFDSTSDDSDRSYFTLKGATNNGVDSSNTIVDQKKVKKNIITDYDDGTDVYLTNILSGGDIDASKSVVTYTTDYFPTYFYMNLYKKGHAGFGNAKYTVYLEVQNTSGSWITLCSDSASKTGGWGDMYNSGTCPSDKMPRVSRLVYTKTPAASITVPRNGEQPVSSAFDACLYDQYGIVWHEDPGFSFTEYHAGVTISGKELFVSSDANSSDGADTQLTLNAEYSTFKAQTTITLQNATYTYQFQNEDGEEISSGSLKYGQSVPKPDNLTKDYTATKHYIFNGWSPDMPRITKDVVFTPRFSEESHSFLSYVSDHNATCTEDGTKTSTCSCGFTNTIADRGSALGHSYSYGIAQEPGCTEPGIMRYTCIRCGDSYTEEIAPHGHSYTAITVPPTCTEQGYVLHRCAHCDSEYKDEFTAALEHDWNEGVITTQPDCTSEGVKTFTCARCGESKTEAVEALGHAFRSWTIRSYPNCTVDGEKFATCTRCKEVITQTLPAYGHSWSEWAVKTTPTCEQEGINERYCLICTEEETEPVSALGHDFVLKTKAPDNGAEGMIYYECTRHCGKYASCVMDAQGEKQVGEVCEQEELEAKTIEIPTAAFNTYDREDGAYNYVNRGAALRIDYNGDFDKQALRFCASMTVPEGAEVIDFGYIYTRSDYFKIKKFVLGGDNVFATSVINGKYTKYQTALGEVRTFNVVLAINRENWDYDYIARPYIIYSFAGETYTVYDSMYSNRSVNFVANKVLNSPYESSYVKNYIQSKIFAS